MKKRFYLVRHGEKVKQIGDPPLSEKGFLQAKLTGKYFKTIPIKKIISSPILRTKQTAQQIAEVLALDFVIHDFLKERVNWGDDPTQSFADFLAMWERASEERDWLPPVGDSSSRAGKRLEELVGLQNCKPEHVVLVTHGGIITDFLRNVFTDTELDAKFAGFDKAKDAGVLECSITTVDFDPKTKKYELVELASVKHLTI